MSNETITRRINFLADNIENQLIKNIQKLINYRRHFAICNQRNDRRQKINRGFIDGNTSRREIVQRFLYN